MTSKNVFVGNWSYIMPDTKANSNGRIVLIKKLSFGPCEVYEWGIDNNGLPYEEYKWCENVCESKEIIMESGVPYIVARGNKGGSNVAAAICNALIYKLYR